MIVNYHYYIIYLAISIAHALSRGSFGCFALIQCVFGSLFQSSQTWLAEGIQVLLFWQMILGCVLNENLNTRFFFGSKHTFSHCGSNGYWAQRQNFSDWADEDGDAMGLQGTYRKKKYAFFYKKKYYIHEYQNSYLLSSLIGDNQQTRKACEGKRVSVNQRKCHWTLTSHYPCEKVLPCNLSSYFLEYFLLDFLIL